ncbi:helix-turn-helix transcriptional regulator [Pararhodospirillum oryzae]|uniref:WYL domain-containing protein n=1 Tax=Pararhodospirillum oryzae TaxID=478448 RepID=A0A512H501_9PROT|nr:WYL domain-containing protein [Pararhodospirillum oryzae]GEO80494.1 WYL domain-containing protein [Pararhodospirillum oryzae]
MGKKRNDRATGRDKLLVLYQRLTLLAGKKLFQADLARDLDCSSQTVSRLIGVIEFHLGADVEILRGKEDRRLYYCLKSKSQEKTLGFSFEELEYLALCRDLAGRFLPSSVADRIHQSMTTLALHLGEPNRMAGNGAPLSFRPKGYIDYTDHLPLLGTLRQAIAKRQVCEIGYHPAGGSIPRLYRHAPGRLLAMSGTLYVQGYRLAEGSLLKDRPTTFSVHRLTEVRPTGEYFTFDAADLEDSAFGLNWHEPRWVRIHVAPSAADYVRDRKWSSDQNIEEHEDGSLVLSLSTTSEKELNAWVWSFGGLARIEGG